jgi:hypothetical protein
VGCYFSGRLRVAMVEAQSAPWSMHTTKTLQLSVPGPWRVFLELNHDLDMNALVTAAARLRKRLVRLAGVL